MHFHNLTRPSTRSKTICSPVTMGNLSTREQTEAKRQEGHTARSQLNPPFPPSCLFALFVVNSAWFSARRRPRRENYHEGHEEHEGGREKGHTIRKPRHTPPLFSPSPCGEPPRFNVSSPSTQSAVGLVRGLFAPHHSLHRSSSPGKTIRFPLTLGELPSDPTQAGTRIDHCAASPFVSLRALRGDIRLVQRPPVAEAVETPRRPRRARRRQRRRTHDSQITTSTLCLCSLCPRW